MNKPLKHTDTSFRTGVLRIFFLFQALLIFLGVNFVIISFTDGHDSLQEAIVMLEADHFIRKYQQDPSTPLPSGSTLTSYLGTQDMPAEFIELFKDLPPGLHEIDVYKRIYFDEDHEFRVLIRELGEGLPLLYFVSDIPEEQAEEVLYENAINVLIFYVAFSLLLGAWLAWIFSRNISKPLEKMADSIKSMKTEEPSTNLSNTWKKGEVGVLARVLDERNRRIADFIQREKRVMRNISHELRTPITIIRSTLSLAHPVGSKNKRASEVSIEVRHVEKIERATKDLESMIEAFLWLGREGNGSGEISDATSLLEKAIADHEYMLEGKSVSLNLQINRQVKLRCKGQIFYIAAANLIRNAFTFADSGEITIYLNEKGLKVEDQGPGLSGEVAERYADPEVKGLNSQGFGLGLHIVEQICQKQGWKLDVSSGKGGTGTVASVYFP